MIYPLNILRTTRNNLLSLTEGLTLEQLNEVPAGFNNSIAWNITHMLVTQQIICYRLAGQPCLIPEKYIEGYKKGTHPERPITEEEITQVKSLLLQVVEQTETDLKAGKLQEYTEYMTSFNVSIKSIEEAIAFNNVHEGLHYGYIMALKRIVNK